MEKHTCVIGVGRRKRVSLSLNGKRGENEETGFHPDEGARLAESAAEAAEEEQKEAREKISPVFLFVFISLSLLSFFWLFMSA